MKLIFVSFLALIVCYSWVSAAPPGQSLNRSNPDSKIRYDNYSVYKLKLKNRAQISVIDLLANLPNKYNIWKDYDDVSQEVHIMVEPHEKENFIDLLKNYGLQLEVMVPNVQDLIDEEQTSEGTADNDAFGWTRYYGLAEIEQWLDKILATYPAVTESFLVGQSYEGRNIRGIKISYKANNPGIFIESNIHAREWITSATATWFINQLLTSQQSEIRSLAENYDWYIVPVFNVDGFAYSHATDRMWRKTRQPVSTSSCIGTDGNRNFDSHWMENNGASSNPCSETFAGPVPFSEPEAQALANYFSQIADKINIYLSFHSYGQYLLSPYGHTTTEFPENYDDILDIGGAFADAISSLPYNTQYTYGSTATALYVASGSTVDYFFNTYDHIKLGYTIEYRDKGRYGFVLPPVQILPNCEELMAGMLALVNRAQELQYL